MIGDYGNQGTNALGLREIVWLDNTPIAIVHVVNGNHSATAGDFAYIHSDHLNTPRALVRGTGAAAGTTIWTWQLRLDPFGETLPNQDPDADGLQYAFNLRFPGQHFDNETGLHYNYFRDYETGTGRYVQSDPIGLGGGSATYSYVTSNPTRLADPYGLVVWTGEMYTVNAGAMLAGGLFLFDLKSECVDGYYAYGHVFASGIGAGYGFKQVPLSLGGGPLIFDDGNNSIDTNVFDGYFSIFSAGAGAVLAAGWSYIQLGQAFSTPTAWPSTYIGVDGSAIALGGKSTPFGFEIKPCQCKG